MLARIYVEALLVDADLADQVWEAWHAGLISDDLAALAWSIIARFSPTRRQVSNCLAISRTSLVASSRLCGPSRFLNSLLPFLPFGS